MFQLPDFIFFSIYSFFNQIIRFLISITIFRFWDFLFSLCLNVCTFQSLAVPHNFYFLSLQNFFKFLPYTIFSVPPLLLIFVVYIFHLLYMLKPPSGFFKNVCVYVCAFKFLLWALSQWGLFYPWASQVLWHRKASLWYSVCLFGAPSNFMLLSYMLIISLLWIPEPHSLVGQF